jgi:hypothetical protein
MLWPEWCGGFYQALSPVFGADTAVNVYTETREVPGSAKSVTMYGTPGLTNRLTVGTRGNRGWFSQDGLTITVVGGTLYSIDTGAYTATSLGAITDDGAQVYFASNGAGGNQIGIVGGGQLKVLTISTLALSAAITLPFSLPVMITFQDGYGFINEKNTPIIWFSALEDLTLWDSLDFFTRSASSDNIIGITVSRDRVWALGSKTTTLFYDSGDADTPWVPYPGTTIQTGLISPSLLGVYNDQLYWVADSQKGQPRVVRAVDPQVQEVSTPPINHWLASCPSLTNGELLIYEQNGHPFVVVTAPSSPDDIQTYAFDVRENLWHARAGLDTATGLYTRWRARGSAATTGVVFVGDYDSGDLYTLDLDTYTDNGVTIKRERAAPYLSQEPQWLFVPQIQLLAQAGVGIGGSGSGNDPTVQLSISRDGARSWIVVGTARLGQMGEYLTRTIWRQVGRVRADLFVIKMTQTAPVKCVWGPLALTIENGTGGL